MIYFSIHCSFLKPSFWPLVTQSLSFCNLFEVKQNNPVKQLANFTQKSTQSTPVTSSLQGGPSLHPPPPIFATSMATFGGPCSWRSRVPAIAPRQVPVAKRSNQPLFNHKHPTTPPPTQCTSEELPPTPTSSYYNFTIEKAQLAVINPVSHSPL